MSSNVSRLGSDVRITMADAVSADAGSAGGRQQGAAGSMPIFNAVMAIAQGHVSDLEDAKKQLEGDLGGDGMTKGLVYTMLGAVDTKIAQSSASTGQVDTNI